MAVVAACATHPDIETALSCGRCSLRICGRCVVPTEVGTRCRTCVPGRAVRVEIADLGALSGLAQMAGLVQGEKKTESQVEKTWQSGGRTLQEEYRKDGSHAETKAILKNGLVVSVEADQMAIQDVRGLMEKIDLSGLENLPRKGKS